MQANPAAYCAANSDDELVDLRAKAAPSSAVKRKSPHASPAATWNADKDNLCCSHNNNLFNPGATLRDSIWKVIKDNRVSRDSVREISQSDVERAMARMVGAKTFSDVLAAVGKRLSQQFSSRFAKEKEEIASMRARLFAKYVDDGPTYQSK